MELLAVILLVITLVILLSFKWSANDHFRTLQNELDDLRKLVNKSIQESRSQVQEDTAIVEKKLTKPEKDKWESGFRVQERPSPVEPSQQQDGFIKKNEEADPLGKKLNKKDQPEPEKTLEMRQVITPTRKVSEPVPAPSFFERYPDLEKFIGENLISKVGIAILVLAIGFFVKYAIDKNWIGPVARVGIGILFGGILIGIAHRLHKNYKAFSSVLVGGGLAIFYFTIALAYHQFHLFSQTVSFVIMVVITFFAVMLSILYNRQELAVIALAGGFATPLLVSDGAGNFVALFSYLLILNTGLLIISYYKSWRLLNILAFCFTTILFFLWMIGLTGQTAQKTYLYGFLFATAFYILFFIVNILNNIKEKKQFIASDFSILLANTAFYFSVGLYFLSEMGSGAYRGMFTAVLGAFNLLVSWLLLRKQSVDRNILYLLIGITISFISLAAPVQLKGNNITLFWASESVLLYWLYKQSGIPIIRLASLIVWVGMLMSLLMDWSQFYFIGVKQNAIIFNKGFITTIYAASGSYLLFILRKKDARGTKNWIDRWPIGNVFLLTSLVLFFMAGILEINYQFSYHFTGSLVKLQYLFLYTYCFVIILYLVVDHKQKSREVLPFHLYLMITCLIIYLFSITANFSFLHQVLREKIYMVHLFAHWTAVIVLGIIYFIIVKRARNSSGAKNLSLITWMLCSWIVIYLSSEVNLAVQSIYYDGTGSLAEINRSFVKSGLPILWGLCSFAFMWLGMKYKYRPLRILSLVLFSITLIKLFAFDIRNISAGGKIAAFFCLGVLLLIISFMYQRLKKLITEDAEKPII